jgi:hypothetical protein
VGLRRLALHRHRTRDGLASGELRLFLDEA